MATRWYNLQEILAEVAHDGDFSEFEDGTDESENSENSADEASNFVNDQELEVNLIPLNDQEAHYLGVPKLEQIVLKQLLLIEEAQAGVGVTYLLCHLWK